MIVYVCVCVHLLKLNDVGFHFVLHFHSSMHNLQLPVAQDKHNSANLDSQLQEQERIITISYALASEASQRSKEVAGIAQCFV